VVDEGTRESLAAQADFGFSGQRVGGQDALAAIRGLPEIIVRDKDQDRHCGQTKEGGRRWSAP
jgi:hypothetical protein